LHKNYYYVLPFLGPPQLVLALTLDVLPTCRLMCVSAAVSVLLLVRSWRDPAERDDARGGGGGRSHRGSDGRDNVHYDRGDYRRKRYDHGYDDEEEEDGIDTTAATDRFINSADKHAATFKHSLLSFDLDVWLYICIFDASCCLSSPCTWIWTD